MASCRPRARERAWAVADRWAGPGRATRGARLRSARLYIFKGAQGAPRGLAAPNG
jgi:hypothetical protein